MTKAILVAALLFVPSGLAFARQDGLEPIRKLYASAEYEAALSALGRLEPAAAPEGEAEADRYRALCLIALGRSTEAERVIEAIVSGNPSYEPSEEDASPRVRAAFSGVRKRVLPGMARSLYEEGKGAYDRKAYADAASSLQKAVDIMASLSNDASLGDLRVLASGFLDLSRASLAPPPAAAPPEPAASPATPSLPAARSLATIAPVTITQVLPPWNPSWFGSQNQAEFRGAIEVDIDESGNVVGSRLIQPIHPSYDLVLLEASKTWKYVPGRRGDVPSRMVKRVDVVLRPR